MSIVIDNTIPITPPKQDEEVFICAHVTTKQQWHKYYMVKGYEFNGQKADYIVVCRNCFALHPTNPELVIASLSKFRQTPS